MEAELNKFNYLNVGAFALSWLLNSEADLGPDFPFLNGMRELGRRYESIVTPAETTFLISHLVLLFQGIFTVTQMLPSYRDSRLVQDGVQHWFFASAVAQLFWSIDLGFENIVGSLFSVLFMACMVYSNGQILMNQAAMTEAEQTSEQYWLLRFPFNLHTGWTMAVFIMSVNAFITFIGSGGFIQLIFGILSLIGFAAMSWKMLLANGDKPNYAIPSVLSWFVLGIALDGRAGPNMEDYFPAWVVLLFTALSGILGLGMAIFTGYLFYTNEVSESAKAAQASEKEGTAYVAPDSEAALA
mmetsp:Transcript_12820/g.15684  ORF Transcript_12820/g.15684 Transcript_12820/m.15684 type:complete len:299 (+) Transcript_12820:123-1019(+)